MASFSCAYMSLRIVKDFYSGSSITKRLSLVFLRSLYFKDEYAMWPGLVATR